MLFRPDCPVEFLRASSFYLVVLADPMLPIAIVRKVLKADPVAYEISKLARRGDLSRLELAAAATHGLRRARWYGRRADSYLALEEMPPARLQGFADQHDVEASGMLRHRSCPEAVVLAHVLARSARSATWRCRRRSDRASPSTPCCCGRHGIFPCPNPPIPASSTPAGSGPSPQNSWGRVDRHVSGVPRTLQF
jgi:hypothetical protein